MNKKLWQKLLVEVLLEVIEYKIGVLNAKKRFFTMTGRKLRMESYLWFETTMKVRGFCYDPEH